MTFPFTNDDEQDDAFREPQYGGFLSDDEQPPFAEEAVAEDEAEEEEGESGNNRTFLIAAGVIGGLILLSLICMAAYALVFLPQQQAAREAQQAQINLQNTQVAAAFTSTAQVLLFTPTLPPATETPIPTSTNTPVVAEATATPLPDTPTPEPITATVAAAYTQAALMEKTLVPTAEGISTAFAAVTAVPDTGFIDDVGLPGMVIMAAVLMAVIFLARRLRS